MSSNCGSSSNGIKAFNIWSADNPFYWNFCIFYDNIGKKGSFPDIWTFIKIHKMCCFCWLDYSSYFLNKQKIFLFVWTRFTKIGGQFMYSIANSGRLHGQGHQIKWHFQHLYWQDFQGRRSLRWPTLQIFDY